ncbi:tRNA pseudouridine(38-40) synthase TruA [Phycisphaerales bacterium AB-hyl4]|uniref:tRNA pseudouridine synthase A n=1 Tax=Natronomicrosphaera hydrolytica TaxID=3242702 RepID=A0ABV4U7P8_9BACT
MCITQRYKLTIAYDGTNFHGWQKQHPPGVDVPLRTVQQVVEDTLREVLHQPIRLMGASRTDAGVHARGQVAQFDAACPIPLERMALAFNSRLPADVDVRSCEVVPATFDCIGDCTSKQYRYRIWNSAGRPLERRHFVWHCWTPLDLDRMNDAARRLVGMHDVAGFAAAKHGRLSTVRTIHACEVVRDCAADSPEVHVVISGDGFLYNMVRIVAGTLVEVGRGLFEPERIDEILRKADRRLAGPTLPPEGLWLEWIRF